jgi:hypothetical protein
MVAGRPPDLLPENQFPQEAIQASIQEFPDARDAGANGSIVFTWNIASAADAIEPWGHNVARRDRQLRDFWPTETYLAGAVASMSFRNATLDWELEGPDKLVTIQTDMLNSAIAGDSVGWTAFMEKFSQDLYTQDNGAFIELIRSPGMDANSRFRGENAPVLGIAHLDAGQCVRTGDPEKPVIYTDAKGGVHTLQWYEVIPFSNYPSAIESMHGVGYCAETRALRMAQIVRSIMIFKDEKISGRQHKQIHFVSGVSRQDIKDEIARGQEEANNSGYVRFILPAVLASLDPEKPVSTATIDLANLPDGFNLDQEMQWYISGLALAFGVDYQEFAPLPGGNIGSASQSMILHRKTSGKGPAVLMRKIEEGFRNYGVLTRSVKQKFNDKDEQEELERQEVRTKAVEEMAILVNQGVFSPEAAARELVRRGLYKSEAIAGLEDFWKAEIAKRQQTVGNRGGNTIREDANRQDTGKTNLTVGDRLRKALFGERE